MSLDRGYYKNSYDFGLDIRQIWSKLHTRYITDQPAYTQVNQIARDFEKMFKGWENKSLEEEKQEYQPPRRTSSKLSDQGQASRKPSRKNDKCKPMSNKEKNELSKRIRKLTKEE